MEIAAEGNHRGGSTGSSRETHSELNELGVRKLQRCDRQGLCGTVSCANDLALCPLYESEDCKPVKTSALMSENLKSWDCQGGYSYNQGPLWDSHAKGWKKARCCHVSCFDSCLVSSFPVLF